MPNSRWPVGALEYTAPIKRYPDEPALKFARASLQSGSGRPVQEVLGDLKAWFEDEWDGGGVTLETWDEVCVVVLALFGGDG